MASPAAVGEYTHPTVRNFHCRHLCDMRIGLTNGGPFRLIWRQFMGLLSRVRNLLGSGRQLKDLKGRGIQIGENVHIGPMCFLDPDTCWLISIGDNTTLAPRVTVLAHDASTRRHIGFTKIGRVIIGKNVFVGAGAIILPGVTIGDNSIIGAGSVVTKDVPESVVVAGTPAKVVAKLEEVLEKHRAKMKGSPTYMAAEWPISDGISDEKKRQMVRELTGKMGYIE
jgi:maltose O-acetyltransferase